MRRRRLHLPTASLRGSICAEASVLHRWCFECHCRRCCKAQSEQGTVFCCIDSQPFAATYLRTAIASSELVVPVCGLYGSGQRLRKKAAADGAILSNRAGLALAPPFAAPFQLLSEPSGPKFRSTSSQTLHRVCLHAYKRLLMQMAMPLDTKCLRFQKLRDFCT